MTHRIGRCEITRKLGEGNMGVVFAARDDNLSRSVAIKLVQAKWVSWSFSGSSRTPARGTSTRRTCSAKRAGEELLAVSS